MDIIIAGGGVSAFEAAAAARKNCADCKIVIHSAENIPPYRRPALPGLIAAGEEEIAKIFKNLYPSRTLGGQTSSPISSAVAPP